MPPLSVPGKVSVDEELGPAVFAPERLGLHVLGEEVARVHYCVLVGELCVADDAEAHISALKFTNRGEKGVDTHGSFQSGNAEPFQTDKTPVVGSNRLCDKVLRF